MLRISFEDTLRFEAVHESVYRRRGFELIRLPKADVETRFKQVMAVLGYPSPPAGEGGGRGPPDEGAPAG